MASTLKCESCTLRFDRPALLPCGFTSCLRCLRRLAAEHPQYIMCSDCLKRHDVPDGKSVESFPVNKLILDLLENRVVIAPASTSDTNKLLGGPPRRSVPAPPPVKTREVEICSKCSNKTASFERCAHCQATFCVFCFEKHIETISQEVHTYVAAIQEHCEIAAKVVDFYSNLSTGIGTLAESEKRKEAIIEWGEQLKSLLIRAVGNRVGQLCSQVDTLIEQQSAQMTSLSGAVEKVQNVQQRCTKIGQELRASIRPNVPLVYQTCAQVDEEIRSLEQSIDGLGLPYLDNDAVAGDTQRILGEIKSLGKLVCDSKRTQEDIVAAQRSDELSDFQAEVGTTASSSEGGAVEPAAAAVRHQSDPRTSQFQNQESAEDPNVFYDELGKFSFAAKVDAQGKSFGPIWDMCDFTTPDSAIRYAIVIHNKTFVTIVDATNGASVMTCDLKPPIDNPLKLDLKHVAVSVVKRQLYFSQQADKIFTIQLPSSALQGGGPVAEGLLVIAIQGPVDSCFCGMAVDDHARLIYVCDQFRARIIAWSLDTAGQQVAVFPISPSSGLTGDFKPFKCALSSNNNSSSGGVLLAISDLTNEKVVALGLSTPTTGQFIANSVITRGTRTGHVNKPAGLAFDILGQLLVAEGPTRRVQVFQIVPDVQAVAEFPSNTDKLRSPRAVCVFFYGPDIDRQVIAIADNAANAVYFYNIE